ncbi:MAG: PH domain-containing protein [Patescibacteria group bacterium]
MILTLDQDEKIIFQKRKYWFILLAEVIMLSLLFILPLLFYFSLPFQINNNLFLIFFLIWSLFLWVILFIIWTDYYLDLFILTNKRVVDIEQKGLFNREISTLSLNCIQDITIETKGIIATLLNFGNIYIQTAGERERFIIKGIFHPEKTKEDVRLALEQYQKL